MNILLNTKFFLQRLNSGEINHLNFRNVNLSRTSLAKLQGLDFQKADFTGASWIDADLFGQNLSKASFRGINLMDAELGCADLSYANLEGADLSGASLRCANLRGANLRSANLSRANLSGADLSYADLSNSNFYEAKLNEEFVRGNALRYVESLPDNDEAKGFARLPSTKIVSANFHDANLSGAELTGVVFCESNFPSSLIKLDEQTEALSADPASQYELAMRLCTEAEEDNVIDLVRKTIWLKKAAEQGHADAQYELAGCFCFGKGIEKDSKKEAYWYEKAAEQGHAGAQNYLAAHYFSGKGKPQDYEKALYWCNKSAEQGNESSKYARCICLLKLNDFRGAFDGFRVSGRSEILKKGAENPRKAKKANNYKSALIYWQRALDQGDSWAVEMIDKDALERAIDKLKLN